MAIVPREIVATSCTQHQEHKKYDYVILCDITQHNSSYQIN